MRTAADASWRDGLLRLRRRRRLAQAQHAAACGIERLEHFLRRDRRREDVRADRVGYRIGYGGDHRIERSLTGFFRAEGPFTIVGLDDDRFDRRHVEDRQRLVVEKARDLVLAGAEDLLLH